MPIKIAITGHRFIENEDKVKQQLATAIEKIIDDNNGKAIEAYSCLALGADSFFADVAFNNKLPLTAILPFKEKEYLKDFTYNSEKKKLKEYLKNCKTITVVSNTSPTAQKERNKMYLAAGKKLVDNCDILFALWDGKDAIGTGGTGDIVDYATKNNKQLIHLNVNRQNEIEKQHNIKDQEAIELKEQYEKDWKFTTKMSLAAALILAISVGFHSYFHYYHKFHLLGIISTIELCFIAIATFFALRIVSTTKNLKRLGTRLEAERLRVMNKFYLAKISIDPIPTESNFLSDEYYRLEKKYADKEVGINDFDASKKYLLNLVEGQIDYHFAKPIKLKPEYHKLEEVKKIATFLFFIGAIVHTIFAYLLTEKHIPIPLDFNDWMHNIALCIVIFAPAVFAYIEATIYLKEFTKTKLNSTKMHKFFIDVKQKIENLTAQDIDTFNSLANEIRIQMDAELLDWYEIMKEKKVSVG